MQKKPFFARFLETQETVKTDVKAGHGHKVVTTKYPSDNEDNGGGGTSI
ncbi:MAG TPA: microviridin/marinostatin family tricyclic proteinase inhibitor [Thermoanaerobaculia bacterium]|nr:microviridin/marinostatin family tricyclic proteinase inhibitor [Thermoanaerobaculia bacterium]